MSLYQMIYKRRSIRKYKNEQISDQLLKDIMFLADHVTRFYPDIKVKIDIKENLQGQLPMKGMWKVKAPYYLVFYSEEKEGSLVNAGYILEPVLLYMTAKGLGTCYLGGAKLNQDVPEGMKMVIAVAFGYPENLLYRDPATAKRLSLKELCIFKEEIDEPMKNILKAVRLAPSAMNTQPWRFIVYHDRIYIFACREFLPLQSMAAMREVSMGIMLSHLSVAAEEMWINLKMEVEEQMIKKHYKSGAYIATAFLSE